MTMTSPSRPTIAGLTLLCMLLALSPSLFGDAAQDNARVAEERARAADLEDKAKRDAAIAAEKAKARFNVTKRSRTESKEKEGEFSVVTKDETWLPAETAVIVCDMWDLHHCLNAVRRVEELVPRMNQVLERARIAGATIIHAPSDCMKFYEDHPGRAIAKAVPKSKNLPKDIEKWCHKIPSEERGKYPIDQSDGGEDDDPKEHAEWAAKLKEMGRNPRAPWKRQHEGLIIREGDPISDSGVEIWSLLEARGIKNVILVGVHTNMCVLGRPFGLRRMAENGKNVVLMRDMTDTMYNPKMWPYVSHFKGTELIVEHIEKYVCPTITSDQLIGGKVFKFKGDDAK